MVGVLGVDEVDGVGADGDMGGALLEIDSMEGCMSKPGAGRLEAGEVGTIREVDCSPVFRTFGLSFSSWQIANTLLN